MQNEIFEVMPVRKAYMKMALPLVLSMVVTLVYNMVDTYFIALTGNTNLVAGVSLGAPIFTLMIALGDIMGLGGSSVISRMFGRQDVEAAKRLSVFCFYGALIGGIGVSVILMVFRAPILTLLGASTETLPHTSQYYTFIALGAPFLIVTFPPSNLLRAEGLATESMVGTITGAVINMILDPIFIFGLKMGAGGAALATVIGYICSDLLFVWVILKKSQKLSVDPRLLRVTAEELRDILAIGFPASITNLMQSLGIMLTNRFLLSYGNDKIATMGIVMKINMIAVLVLIGFAFGGQALVGYNYGSGNKKRFHEIVTFSYKFEVGLALVVSVVMAILSPVLVRIFLKDAALVAIGVPMLRLQVLGMVFVAVVLITTCVFQATGKAVGALILSASRQGVIFAIALVVASKVMGYYGVLAAQAIADFLTAIIAVVLYLRMFGQK